MERLNNSKNSTYKNLSSSERNFEGQILPFTKLLGSFGGL